MFNPNNERNMMTSKLVDILTINSMSCELLARNATI